MKVICIDGNPKHPRSPYLPEGIPLEVSVSDVDQDYYDVEGYQWGFDGVPTIWHKRRFIPLSTIDETEMIRNYQTEKV